MALYVNDNKSIIKIGLFHYSHDSISPYTFDNLSRSFPVWLNSYVISDCQTLATSMQTTDKRFQEYYKTKKYKGFYKLRKREYKLLGQTKMTFTNGEKEIFATGPFEAVTLKTIFDKIDKYVQLNTVDNSKPNSP